MHIKHAHTFGSVHETVLHVVGDSETLKGRRVLNETRVHETGSTKLRNGVGKLAVGDDLVPGNLVDIVVAVIGHNFANLPGVGIKVHVLDLRSKQGILSTEGIGEGESSFL